MNNKNELLAAIQRLDAWVEKNGWSGWDPYDIRGAYLPRKIERLPANLLTKIVKKLVLALLDIHPLYARRLFGIRPEINAKGMGLFLASYCNLFNATKNQNYLHKASQCAEWLIDNRNENFQGWGWGYPFDWYSPIYIPKGIPSSIASATIGDGFYKLYGCTGNDKYLQICKKICDFFMNGLKITYKEGDAICFSYTPLDNYQVHNTNLIIGEFLTRVGKETGDKHLTEMGFYCGNFALKEQQPEGFLPYWGLSQTDLYSNGKLHTDHYHSGFEIRMVYGIWKNTSDVRFRDAYVKYFDWYLKNLFDGGIIPKFTPKSKYPINIHSCAEAILCRATLLPDHPEQAAQLENTVEWTLKNMEYKDGEYTYLIKRFPVLGERKINIPMIRWGQAWMFRALSELYLKCI